MSQPYSYVLLPGDGATTTFSFSFPYLQAAHIHVSVNGVEITPSGWLSANTIEISPAPANGAIVEIRRITPKDEPIVNFTDGSTLLEEDLDLSARFSLYCAQEAADGVEGSVHQTSTGVWDGQNRRATNFADPVNPQDLVTKGYYENFYTTQMDAKVAAATTQATNAATSATVAQGYALAADNSADLAAALLATFKGQYLGASATPPTVDGNGLPLTAGDLYFDTTALLMKVHNGAGWIPASSTVNATINKPTSPVVASVGQASLTVPGGYNPGFIQVFINGALISAPDVDTSSGTVITFTPPLSGGEEIMYVAFGAFQLANAVTPSQLSSALDQLSVNVKDARFGASGSGTGDDSAAINAAISFVQLAGGGTVFLPPGGVYRCLSRLNITGSGVRIAGHGAVLDFSAMTEMDGSVYKAVKIAGPGFGTAYALTADAVEGAYVATVSPTDAANFQAGDWVQVTTEASYAYTASVVKRGEIKQIQSISSGTIRFRQALYDTYTTASTARIRKVSFITDVAIEGVEIRGANTENRREVGMEVEFVNRFRVAGCRFNSVDMECLRVFNAIRGDIEGNWFSGVRYTGTGTLFYAAVLYNCTQWVNVRFNHGHQVRHLVTTSATTTKYGEPFFCNVVGNIAENSQAGDSFSSWAFENHGFGRWIIWAHNQADSCHTGINLEKGEQIVAHNIFKNCRFNGILISQDAADVRNILITGNIINRTTTDPDAPAGQARAISLEDNAANTRRNIRIVGNHIYGWGHTSRSGCFAIRVGTGSGAATGCAIEGNSMENSLAYRSADYGCYLLQDGWAVKNNSTLNYERAFYLAGANITFSGNEVALDVAPASTLRSVEIRGNNTIAVYNTFRGVYQAFFVNTGVSGTKIAGNSQVQTTVATVQDSGTGTVFGFNGTPGF